MINLYIKQKLIDNNTSTLNEFINVIREECQKIILYSLGKTDFFNHFAFYGGTCLRIFHNLNRYSEDLDFNVLNKDEDVFLNKYMNHVCKDLESFGFDPSVKTKEEYDIGEIRRRYIIIPIFNIVNEYFERGIINKEQNISIKLEVSTDYPVGATFERKLLTSPLFSTILCFDYPSLFAGKLCALLARNWPNREKGRDFYDYMFYLSNEVKYNQDYLRYKLSYSLKEDYTAITLQELQMMLLKRFNDTNFDLVKKDIITFVTNPASLDSINKETYMLSVDLINNS